jgi:hypothetical protein
MESENTGDRAELAPAELEAEEAVDLPDREAMTVISSPTGGLMPIDPVPPGHPMPDPIPVMND